MHGATVLGQRVAALGEDGVLLFVKLERRQDAATAKGAATDEEAGVENLNLMEGPWQAEPLGFTTVPKSLTRLMWEQPLFLLGVADDGAIFILVGLQKLVQEPQRENSLRQKNDGKPVTFAEKLCTSDLLAGSGHFEESVNEEYEHSDNDTSQNQDSDTDDTSTTKSKQQTSDECQPPSLDLSNVLFFRQATKRRERSTASEPAAFMYASLEAALNAFNRANKCALTRTLSCRCIAGTIYSSGVSR